MVRWEGGSFLVLFKGGECRVQNFIFLFLMLIKGTKRQDVFKIICMAPGIERLSLCLQQTVKNIVCALVGKFKCGKVG